MSRFRIIPRLDIKGANLIKSVQLEGLRVVGDPHEFAVKYYEQGADEIIYMDSVASLYGRNSLADLVSAAAKDIFIPLTVGGGIRTVEDAYTLLRCGADKVAVNTAAVSSPQLLRELALRFGSQAVVLSIEAKKISDDKWEVFTDNGRERTGLDVKDWILQALELGVGEILLTSIDREGTRKGLDMQLLKMVTAFSTVPVIASGGVGSMNDIEQAYHEGAADAVALADIIHYNRVELKEIKRLALSMKLPVRE